MDLNIGAALWLAASGRGRLTAVTRDPTHNPPLPGPSVAESPSPPSNAPQQGDSPPGTSRDSSLGLHSGIHSGKPGGSKQQQHVPVYENISIVSPVYCSPARVVLLGHGADEQCAGYGRHRTR